MSNSDGNKSDLPPTIQNFIRNVESLPLTPQNSAASFSVFQATSSSLKRRRYILAVILFAAPQVYSYLRSQYLASQFYQRRRQRIESFSSHLETAEKQRKEEERKKSSSRVAVDGVFMRKLRFLLSIVIPSWSSKEMGMLTLHSGFLIARTYLSVVVARIDGFIVKHLVAGNGRGFAQGIAYWFLIALPATFTNSMIRYLQSKLALSFRSRLTKRVHDLYLDQLIFYKLLNLDSRIEGPDQLICTDVARFCDTLSSLYSNLAKPVLDTIIFNYQLTKSIGATGMVALFVNYLITARILRMVTPGFGKLAAVEAKLEGDFRGAHTRVITNAEEIAFYHGDDRELGILDRTYRTLIRHVNRIYRIRIAYNMFEDFIIKYSWSAVGLLVASVPVFFPKWAGSSQKLIDGGSNSPVEDKSERQNQSQNHGSRTQGFITNKRLMISLADAGGRIMYSYKELAELAGFTARVYDLMAVLDDMKNDRYQRRMLTDGGEGVDVQPEFSLNELEGRVVFGYEGIRLIDLPIVTPSGDKLVQDLSFNLQPGMHVLVTGPNGVGKSAIMRIISGLWPVFRGELDVPVDQEIIYIPQRAYLSIGSLRDQIIYPHSHADMLKYTEKTDEDLMRILEIVHLDYLPEREGGFEVVKEWKDVLSGGEKQRMNLARLFYHRPQFAVLDECTSAVSTDVEGLMYSRAKDMGITLLTISHKPSLLKHHDYLLKIHGGGGKAGSKWEWSSLSTTTARLSVDKEMKQLRRQIAEEPKLRKKLVDINKQLGVKAGATKK